MSDLIYLVQQGSGKYQSKITTLIDPLARIYGVNAHAYYRIDSQGFLTYISNFPHIAEYYFANKLYIDNPFLKHPSLIQPGFVMSKTVSHSNFQKGESEIEKKYQLNNQFLIIEKEDDILHAHGFATTNTANDLTNVYLNNLERLTLYCRFFREETHHIQNKLDSIDFGHLIGSSFTKNESFKIPVVDKDASREFFYWMNNSHGGLELVKPLSVRELQCLELMMEGNSASEIAKQLIIATRTAEHHIDSIKNKLSCSTRKEIFSYIATLKACGGNLSFLRYLWK